MKVHVLNRKIHYWLAAAVAVPAVVVFASGVLLQVKKQVAWVQPPEQRGSGQVPAVSFDAILTAVRGVTEAGVRDWADVDRLDVRPSKGLIKVTCQNGQEVQLDAATGAVLQVAVRRSDWIEAIHDGSWFHPLAKTWIFLPAALGLLTLWATGVWLFALPLWVKWKRRRAKITN